MAPMMQPRLLRPARRRKVFLGCPTKGHADAEDTPSPCAFRCRFQLAHTQTWDRTRPG